MDCIAFPSNYDAGRYQLLTEYPQQPFQDRLAYPGEGATLLKFEWDLDKAEANLRKHRVSFAEAISVFGDPLARIFLDENHSIWEQREIIIDHSNQARFCWSVSRNQRKPGFESSALDELLRENSATMKNKANSRSTANDDTGLRREYKFDYKKAKPNRFAGKMRPGSVFVLLDPDVAQTFKTAEEVNNALRALLVAMPKHGMPLAR